MHTRKCSASKWLLLLHLFRCCCFHCHPLCCAGFRRAVCQLRYRTASLRRQECTGQSWIVGRTIRHSHTETHFGCETCVWICGDAWGISVSLSRCNTWIVCVCCVYALIPFVEQSQIQAHAHMGSNLEPGMRVVMASWGFTCYILLLQNHMLRFKQRI